MTGLTFGERVSLMEERIDALGQAVNLLLYLTGVTDENGEFAEEVDVDETSPGSPER